jgi:YHS domain-containing protein
MLDVFEKRGINVRAIREAVVFHLSGWYERLRGRDPDELVLDPVCHMQVHPLAAARSRRHGDEEIFFCSSRCIRHFEADPDRYLGRPEQGI